MNSPDLSEQRTTDFQTTSPKYIGLVVRQFKPCFSREKLRSSCLMACQNARDKSRAGTFVLFLSGIVDFGYKLAGAASSLKSSISKKKPKLAQSFLFQTLKCSNRSFQFPMLARFARSLLCSCSCIASYARAHFNLCFSKLSFRGVSQYPASRAVVAQGTNVLLAVLLNLCWLGVMLCC